MRTRNLLSVASMDVASVTCAGKEAAVRKLQGTGLQIPIGRSAEQKGRESGIDVPACFWSRKSRRGK
jgi:hypothetical protein